MINEPGGDDYRAFWQLNASRKYRHRYVNGQRRRHRCSWMFRPRAVNTL
jgi:hypothetical protein